MFEIESDIYKKDDKAVNSLWVEKYRPTDFTTYVGNEDVKEAFESYIYVQDIPHLLLYGSAGGGKTTAAKILINKIKCDFMIINASDENGVDTIREKIKNFASTQGFNPLKIILLDEADYLTHQGQSILRNLMETFSNHCRFILTCNYVEKIISPIQSRCQTFNITPPTKKDVAKQISHILTGEGVKFEVKDLVPIIDNGYPDMRKIINQCQQSTKKGVLTPSKENLLNADFKTNLIEILKSKEGKPAKFMLIRQAVADSRIKDFSEIYTHLFKRLDEYAPEGNYGQYIITIQKGQYEDNFSVDKELCFMACIVNLLII
jgi:DNA polymerase III delta prime subunit